jgi:phosphatidate phosphatase APP1
VSSSPWQLYSPLQEFVRDAGFPWATMSLKEVRFRDETLLNLFKKGTDTKPAQIEPILQHYPHRQFILIGDSGEEDPEVYGDITRRYPSQICRILIRNVDGSVTDNDRYKKAFENVAQSKWQLFNDPEQIEVNELLNCR